MEFVATEVGDSALVTGDTSEIIFKRCAIMASNMAAQTIKIEINFRAAE